MSGGVLYKLFLSMWFVVWYILNVVIMWQASWTVSLFIQIVRDTYTHTRFTAHFPGIPRWAGTRKVTNLDFTEARDSEWQWHQLGHMQVCTSLQADNHASTPPLCFLQAGCLSCRPTNSVKALKAYVTRLMHYISFYQQSVTHFLPTDCKQQKHFHYFTCGLLIKEIPFRRLCLSVFNMSNSVIFSVYACTWMHELCIHV